MTRHRLLMVSTHGYFSAKPELGRPDTGGQVVYVLELSKALASHGFHVDILTRQFEDREEYEEVDDRVRIIRIPFGGPKFIPKELLSRFVPELVNKFLSDSRLNHDEYFMINSHYWDAGVAGVNLAQVLDIPHVHTPHSVGLLKRQNGARNGAKESSADCFDERIQGERVVYHHSNLILATAGEQVRCLTECDEYNISSKKIVQIPPGFDEALFYPANDEFRMTDKQDLGWEQPTVFAAGRISESKGYDLLIRAFPAVLQRIPNARLVFAIGGTNPSRDEGRILCELKQLAQNLGITDKTTFLPSVDQPQLARFYRAADVFVLCSRNEPFGMTAIEAMASGTPTVITTHGGLWEELTWGRDCIYCDPNDTDALAQAVCSPLSHPKIYQQLSRNGAKTAVERYTWSEVARRVIESCIDRQLIFSTADFELAHVME
jgi:mannosylfructose-phosphate synthase